MTEKNYPVVKNGALSPIQSGVEARDLALCSTERAREKLSYGDALKWGVLPLNTVRIGGGELLTIVTSKTLTHDREQALRFLTDCSLKPLHCEEEVLQEAIFKAYRSDESELNIAFKEVTKEDAAGIPELLRQLVELGLAKEASDITIIPSGGETFGGKLRIDGKLLPFSLESYTDDLHRYLINRIRILARLKVNSPGEPQDGTFTIDKNGSSLEIRFHIFPTIFGEKINLRLPQKIEIPELPTLGLSTKTSHFIHTASERLEGAIILSGPTGGGKTTTLYSIVNSLKERSLSLVSLEDPVEQRIAGISQTDISHLPTGSYSEGLKNIFRQDPDIILVGEVRDEESAKVALEGAATGHLLLTSVHGSSVLGVIQRLKRLCSDSHLVAQGVSLVIFQRLLPKLCTKCKVVDLKGVRAFKRNVYQAVGCAHCNYTGYSGRVLIDEALYITEEIRGQIVSDHLREAELIGKANYQSLSDSVYAAIVSGEIDLKSGKQIMPL